MIELPLASLGCMTSDRVAVVLLIVYHKVIGRLVNDREFTVNVDFAESGVVLMS